MKMEDKRRGGVWAVKLPRDDLSLCRIYTRDALLPSSSVFFLIKSFLLEASCNEYNI